MNISDYIRGYVSYEFECSHPEGYINDLRKLIPLRRIKRIDDHCFSLRFYYGDICKVREREKAWKVTVRREKCRGFPYILHKYRKRAGLFTGAVLGIAMIYVSSLFVWEISVEGNEKISSSDIEKRLYELGFHEGIPKKSVDIQALHNNYLIADRRISWIFVNFNGTVAHVEVKEATIPPERQDKQRNTNIVASRDGIIVRVDALDGGKEVVPGEVVTKGQLLISTFLETRKSGYVIRNAKGNVFAKTRREYEVKVPLVSYEKKYTGRSKKVFTAKLLDKYVPLNFSFAPDYKYYDRAYSIDELTLFGCIHFPVKIEMENYREYSLERIDKDRKQAETEAKRQLEAKLNAETLPEEILSKNENFEVKDGLLLYTCNMECIENIATNLDFEFGKNPADEQKNNPG